MRVLYGQGDEMSDTTSGREAYQPFLDAVLAGDAAALRSALSADPSIRDVINEPWFHFDAPAIVQAAGQGNLGLIEILLDAGADINAKSAWQPGPYSALHHSVGGSMQVRMNVANYLVSRGAEIDVHSAAGLGRLDLLQKYVNEDPEVVHRRGPDGQMPLSLAGNPETAAFLLEHGADINARCVDHRSTAAQWAVRFRPQMAQYLIDRGAQPDVFMATAIGNEELLKRFVDEDREALFLRVNDETCAVDGARGGNIYIFGLGNNATLLHIAARMNQKDIIPFLVNAGLDVNVAGEYDDCTPLHIAAWENNVDAARSLLEHGADINRESGELHHATPLGWAIVAGSVDMAAFLIKSGARILSHFVDLAKEGEAGTFRSYARYEPERYRKIGELLATANSEDVAAD